MPISTGALQQSALTAKMRYNARPSAGPRRSSVTVVAAAPSSDLGAALRGLQAAKDAVKASGSAPAVSVVPGTEMIAPAPPTAPPAPTQGMDLVLEQLKAKEAAAEAARAVKTSAAAAPKLDLPKVELPKVDFSDIKVPDLPRVDLTKVELGVPKVDIPKVDLDVSAPLGATKEAASAAAGAAAEAAGAAASVVGENVQQAAAAASAAAAAVSGQVDSVVSTADALVQQTQAAAAQTVGSLVGSAEAQVAAAVGTLPPPVRDALGAAAAAAGDAVHLAVEQPLVGAGAAAVPALFALYSTFGGYAGPFAPAKALEVLKAQDALLVDIRSERQRLDSGIPELKRGARGKGVALPAYKLLPSVARRVRNADALAIEILGAQIAALARRGGTTRLVIMDDRGEVGKAVARAATAAGVRRAHTLDGGFRAWRAAGLPVAEKASEYSANPLGVVEDVAEEVAEEAAALLSTPSTAALVAGGAALAALAAFNYHFLFRFIGVLGIEATIVWRVLQYESPQDALDDLNAALGAAQQLAGKVTAALPAQTTAAAGQQQTPPPELQQTQQTPQPQE